MRDSLHLVNVSNSHFIVPLLAKLDHSDIFPAYFTYLAYIQNTYIVNTVYINHDILVHRQIALDKLLGGI